MSRVRSILFVQGCAITLTILAHGPHTLAAEAVATTRLADLPVIRATVFKDGTAMLVHRGDVNCDGNGIATISGLPAPILGTFWTSAPNTTQRIRSVESGFVPLARSRAAVTLEDLLIANIGRTVTLSLAEGDITGEIIGLPARPLDEFSDWRSSSGYSYGYYNNRPVAGDPVLPSPPPPINVLVRDDSSLHAVAISAIRSLQLPTDAQREVVESIETPALTVDFGPGTPASGLPLELMYLQRGLRWIPNYRVTLGHDGRAFVELQASVINDAVDLDNTIVEFIVGVPSFAFDEAIDPISLRNLPPVLSGFFSRLAADVLSNIISTQMARADQSPGGSNPNPAPLESLGEDQFIYTYPGLTLAKGSRAIVPLKSFQLDAVDVYRLHLPVTPPSAYTDMWNDSRVQAMMKRLRAPIVDHVIAFTNTSDAPITTAPVLITDGNRPVAQSVTRYTPVGAEGEFELSTAVDISASTVVEEIARTPDAQTIDGYPYTRIDLRGRITITNRKREAVTIRVTRDVLGAVASASEQGKTRRLGGFHDAEALTPTGYRWWDWYGQPTWLSHANPLSRIEWSVALDPGESTTLEYEWSYYWR